MCDSDGDGGAGDVCAVCDNDGDGGAGDANAMCDSDDDGGAGDVCTVCDNDDDECVAMRSIAVVTPPPPTHRVSNSISIRNLN